MQRTAWLDIAKAISIVGIVLIHAAQWSPTPSAAADWTVQRLVVALPVFFLVSGMVNRSALASPWRAVGALLWLYVIWQPVVVVYRLIGSAAVDGQVDLVGELLRFLAAPVRPNGELWYLWALAIHLVVAHFCRRLPSAAVVAPAALLWALWSGWGETTLGSELWHTIGPGLQGLPRYLFFTLAGIHYGPALIRWVERRGVAATATTGGAWLVVGQLTASTTGSSSAGVARVQVLLGVITTLLVARQIARFPQSRPLALLGRHTVAPYVGHTLVIVVIVSVLTLSGNAGVFGAVPWLGVAFLTAAGLTVPLIAERTLRGPVGSALFRIPPWARERFSARVGSLPEARDHVTAR